MSQTIAEEIHGTLQRMEPDFKKALQDSVPVGRFIRVAQTLMRESPELLQLDRGSLYGAIMACAQDGLLPDGREAAIVKFGNAVRYIPMVAGVIKKLFNSGQLKEIDAKVVYSMSDHYRHWTDEDGEHLIHERVHYGDDRGPVKCTFAYATTKAGGFFFEEVDEDDMAAIEDYSRAKDGPWKGPFKDEMRRKTALKRLAKRLPISTDDMEVLRRDEGIYDVPAVQSPPAALPPPPAPAASPVVPRRSRSLSRVIEKTKVDAPAQTSPPSPPPSAQLPLDAPDDVV